MLQNDKILHLYQCNPNLLTCNPLPDLLQPSPIKGCIVSELAFLSIPQSRNDTLVTGLHFFTPNPCPIRVCEALPVVLLSRKLYQNRAVSKRNRGPEPPNPPFPSVPLTLLSLPLCPIAVAPIEFPMSYSTKYM